ncbi:MAG: DUF5615 family PIN-like protein [Burkholderiales bacterium]|nr:DUF5615 family PIN-like protein [Burkholderiales bacterium]
MRLLLDENISRRLVPALQMRLPGSSQLALLGLERSTDRALCDYPSKHDLVIGSKDDQFQRLVAARGDRPRLVTLALGNASSERVLAALLAAADSIAAAFMDDKVGVVTVGA